MNTQIRQTEVGCAAQITHAAAVPWRDCESQRTGKPAESGGVIATGLAKLGGCRRTVALNLGTDVTADGIAPLLGQLPLQRHR